jgi:hypothetical protein
MASDIRFKHPFTYIVDFEGQESLHSVYHFYRILTPCVQSRIFQVE